MLIGSRPLVAAFVMFSIHWDERGSGPLALKYDSVLVTTMPYRKFGSTPVCSVFFRVQIVFIMLSVELDTNRIINIAVLLQWPDEAMFLSEQKLEDFWTSMKLSPGGARQYQTYNDHLTAIQRVRILQFRIMTQEEFETMPLGKSVLHCRSVRVLQLKILQDINWLA